MTSLRVFGASAALCLRQLRHEPDAWLVFCTTPLSVMTLLLITRSTGRDDLIGLAVVAPGLMALFQAALFDAAEQLSADRTRGVLEIAVAAPISLIPVVLGRATAITCFALLALVESLLLVGVVTSGPVIVHPGEAALVAAVTVLATVAVVLPISVLFVMTRSVRLFQNALPWPVFLVSGVLVPLTMLPNWVHPLSRGIYLTWAADLLRAATRPEPVSGLLSGLAAILCCAGLALAVGAVLYRWAFARLRRDGGLAFA